MKKFSWTFIFIILSVSSAKAEEPLKVFYDWWANPNISNAVKSNGYFSKVHKQLMDVSYDEFLVRAESLCRKIDNMQYVRRGKPDEYWSANSGGHYEIKRLSGWDGMVELYFGSSNWKTVGSQYDRNTNNPMQLIWVPEYNQLAVKLSGIMILESGRALTHGADSTNVINQTTWEGSLEQHRKSRECALI